MPIASRELSGAPTITIDVIELLHSPELGLSDKQIKAYTSIVTRSAVKNEIGTRVIEAILKNTNAGYDRKGKRFTKYSKAYRDSTVFKIYKGGKRTPNLRLTGDMQADFEVVGSSGNTVTIGFTDAEESEKAKGHILGANHLPVRDFFGLKPTDMHKIMLDVITTSESETDVSEAEVLEGLEAVEVETEGFQEFEL